MTSDEIKFKNDSGYGIHILDANYMRPGMAAVYLLLQDKQIAIIETGTAHTVPRILDAIKQLGFHTRDVSYIIPTHVHLDHAGGAGLLMEHCQKARLVIHPRGARHMIDPAKLIKGAQAVYGKEVFLSLYGKVTPVESDRLIEAPDGFEVDFNGRILKFLDTPGHARHHFCIYDPLSKGIFSGDTFGLCYRELETENGPFIFATTTPVQFEPQALLESIERLLALEPDCFYLTHFGRIEPTSAIIEQLKTSITTFTEIALQERLPVENRIARIEKRMMDYLLDILDKMNCHMSRDRCRKVLRIDVELNAQGLDIWLDRQA